MLGNFSVCPQLTSDSTVHLCLSSPSLERAVSNIDLTRTNTYNSITSTVIKGTQHPTSAYRKWVLQSTAQTKDVVLSDEDKKTWDVCREALSAFEFSTEEEDKILGKAFGIIHSPYWGEERNMEVPKFEVVDSVLNYLRSLSLSDNDLCKMLKKFPEVLGCSLEDELKTNVKILEKDWGIKGKTLQNLLLRNPKVLGYNVDCKGDCMAQCTRCWVRF